MFSGKSVCFVIYSLRGGGSEKVVTSISNYLVQSYSLRVNVILLSNEQPFHILSEKVNLIKPDFSKYDYSYIIYNFKLFKYLRKTYRKIKPDRIVCFGETINSFVIISAFFTNIPVFVSNRASPLSNLSGYRGIVNPLFYPFSKGVFIQTQKGIEILKRKYKFTKFLKLSNPIELKHNVKPIEFRENIIINVGTLWSTKNQSALINYFAQVKNEGWKLFIVGDGPDKKILNQQINNLNVGNKVFLLGTRKDVPELLNNSRIFAFTSLSEGFPNALAEALAFGCACISFNCLTGPSELILDNYNGFLVENNDHESFKSKLSCLMNDPDIIRKFHNNSRKTLKNYSIESITGKFLEYLFYSG